MRENTDQNNSEYGHFLHNIQSGVQGPIGKGFNVFWHKNFVEELIFTEIDTETW